MRLERRILPDREQLGREAERALAREWRRRRIVRRQKMELGRGRRRAERGDEAAALLVVVDAVEDAALELAFANEHALDRERPARPSSKAPA